MGSFDKTLAKLTLLGENIVGVNEWAIVVERDGLYGYVDTSISNGYIAPNYLKIKILEHFLICEYDIILDNGGKSRHIAIHIKGKTNNIVKKFKRIVAVLSNEDYNNEVLLIRTVGKDYKTWLINYKGKTNQTVYGILGLKLRHTKDGRYLLVTEHLDMGADYEVRYVDTPILSVDSDLNIIEDFRSKHG